MKEKKCSHNNFWEFDGKRICARCGQVINENNRQRDNDKGDIDIGQLITGLTAKRKRGKEPLADRRTPVISNLPRCPNEKCRQISLSWNERLLLYNCAKCGGMFSKRQVDVAYKLIIWDANSRHQL